MVDKPPGLSSHDVVARVRRLAGTRRVGHAGTLDPMATGVLVLGVGRATRLLTFLVGAQKDYDATIRLGVATSTDDAQGEVLAVADPSAVTDGQIEAQVALLRGELMQVPSTVSAIKVDGKRAYARARAGEQVELAARPVTISRFDVLASRREPATVDLDVTVTCSSGTYVRALARDLGAALGVGGHLTALRRTRVGPYDLSTARTLEQLGEHVSLLPMGRAAETAFPVWRLDADAAARLRHGQRIPATTAAGYPVAEPGPAPAPAPAPAPEVPALEVPALEVPAAEAQQPVAALAPDGTLVAVVVRSAGLAKVLVVLGAPDPPAR